MLPSPSPSLLRLGNGKGLGFLVRLGLQVASCLNDVSSRAAIEELDPCDQVLFFFFSVIFCGQVLPCRG